MRRLALAVVLACVLSGVVCAGEIHTTGAVGEIPTTGVPATGEIPSTGEIHSTGAAGLDELSTAVTIILTVISIVP